MKVSVIIPAYNSLRFIQSTLESAVGQSFSDFEVILVDDGSTDGSSEVIQSLADVYPQVQYHYQSNAGVAAARNHGFRLAKGDYIAFLDADDIWLPDNLAKKVAYLQQHPQVGLVHSDAAVINGEGVATGLVKAGKDGQLLNDLLLWNGTCIPAPSSILVRREVIEKVGGFDESLSTAADQEFFFRVAAKYPIGRIPEVTWQYRVHSTNMHSNIPLMERDHIKAYQLADKNGLFPNKAFRNQAFSNLYMILAGSFWVQGKQHPKTFLYLLKALWLWPSNLKRLLHNFT